MVETRILYLDDSGKPEPQHPSGAVVIAGFSIDADQYPTLSRRVLGAKRAYFASRGNPETWEVKSTDLVKPNPWRRANNRKFVAELSGIVRGLGGTMCSVTINKSRMKHPMTLATTMPLQLQALVEHFDAECRTLGRIGMVVADWSSHQYDQHASKCVASYVATRRLGIHPNVYYASSLTTEAIQVADVVAAVRRRAEEGDAAMRVLEGNLRRITAIAQGSCTTVSGRPYNNWVNLF